MDPILQVLLSWQFVLFGLAVAMVMYVFRLIVEYIAGAVKADLTKSKLWNELVLPILPIALGVLGGWLVTNFPYPGFTPNAAGIVARGDRLIFGLVAGGFSTMMYRVIKALLYQKLVDTAQSLNVPGVTTTITTTPVAVPPVTTPTTVTPTEQIPAIHLPSRGQL
jgi:hypothetical protein